MLKLTFLKATKIAAELLKRPVLIYRIGGAIGDQLLISAIVGPMANKYPNRPIWVLCTYPALFWNNPSIDRLIDFNSYGKYKKITIKFILKCLKGRYVHQFAYQGTDFLDYMRTSGSEYTLAQTHSAHILDLPRLSRPRLYISDEELSEVALKYSLPSSYVVFNIEAKANFTPNKEWSRPGMLSVINAVSKQTPVVLVGNENSDEILPANVISLCGQTTLRDLCNIVASSKFVVAYEGLLNHIAGALDKRSFVVKGGFTNNVICRYPLTEIVEQERMPKCYNCWQILECENNRDCFSDLTADLVKKKIFQYLEVENDF